MSRARHVLALAVAGALALPASAAAAPPKVFCVNFGTPPAECTDTGYDATQLQDALVDAESNDGPDTVRIAAGTYTRLGGFSHAAADGAVSIEGAGAGLTILGADADNNPHQTLGVSTPDSSVSGLTISMPASMSTGDDGLVLFNDSSAEDVTVTGASGVDGVNGVELTNSSFESGTIDLPLNTTNRGLLAAGNSSVANADVTAAVGMQHSHADRLLTVTRSEVTASDIGLDTDGGNIDVDNTLVDLGAFANAIALRAQNGNNLNEELTIDARHLTIVGGGANSRAIRTRANSATGDQPTAVTLEDSVIAGPNIRIQALAGNGDTATVSTNFSNYDPSGHDIAAGTGTVALSETNQTNFTPGFLNAAAGNYRPVFGSQLIDAGNPSAAGSGSTLDLDDSDRIVDGDGTGPPRRDIGAYELDDLVGPSAQITAGPSGATGDSTPTFEFTASEPGSSFKCRIDGGPFGDCSAAGSHTPVAPLDDGTHKFVVRPTDPSGNVGTVASRTFSVDASAPVIQLNGPSGVITDNTPTFSFSSGETATFECRIDDAGFGPCSGPDNTHTPSPLADGTHTFEVSATDALGNQATASRTFTIDMPDDTPSDTDPPETTLQKPKVKGDDVLIKFGSDEPGTTFRCKLDRKKFKPCASPKKYKNLDDGKHKVSVVGTDAAGNTDPTPAKRKFEI